MNWYRAICVQIKWGSALSEPISVHKGTRQGGLSSPFLFNLFYQDFINELSECTGGIIINKQSFNVLNADDLMLASLTVTGLQTMINVANRYITKHGLQFNPKKTDCVIFGRSTLQPHPEWELNGTKLTETDSVTYLGVTLSYVKPNMHVDNRISACKRAYYAMQGAACLVCLRRRTRSITNDRSPGWSVFRCCHGITQGQLGVVDDLVSPAEWWASSWAAP